MTTTDPRIRQLAEARHRNAEENTSAPRAWNDLIETERNRLLWDAEQWLRAAVAAGIAPPTERPTDKHMAVYVDDEGFLYSEYPTVPESDSILRLVWAADMCDSKREMEDQGAEFHLIGWST
ncbi:hypothetical protein ABZ733_06850 [Streptomyces longwoodensis]|uniref:hypothetical protein n=1 Tax=Streptomyces longwoodensis TaxID=68231 RepID=UPI0034009235